MRENSPIKDSDEQEGMFMGMVQEFKDFIMRGNVMDMAVGVIIGGAFGNIVTSLVNDVLMPVITIATGKISFTDLFIALDGGEYKSLAQAQDAGASVFAYGNFIQNVVEFLIIALCIFMVVKGMNKLNSMVAKPKEEEAPATKICPFCKSEIHKDATKCAFCASTLK